VIRLTQDRSYEPVTPIPQAVDGDNEEESIVTEPDSGGTVWIGSNQASEQSDDGISDLFEFDADAEMDDVDDLVDVDFDTDILDAGEDGTLNDLVDVKREDIMGSPPGRKRVTRLPRRTAQRYPSTPTSMRGTR